MKTKHVMKALYHLQETIDTLEEHSEGNETKELRTELQKTYDRLTKGE